MKQKLFLAVFGVLAGVISFCFAYPYLKQRLIAQPDGAQFESIDDLRRAMLRRDDRDVRQDHSVTLRSIIQPHPSDMIMYELIPNMQIQFQGVPVSINSCGMRGPQRAVKKPENVYRIALLGDSFAFGWGVEYRESFAAVIEDKLNSLLTGSGRVEVLNFGIPGYSTFQEVALFEERALDFEPDAVLVFFVENDFGLPFYIRDLQGSDFFHTSTAFARSLLKRDQSEEYKKRREFINQIDASRALARLSDLAAQSDIPLYLTINPNKKAGAVKEKLWVLDKKQHGISLIELRKPLLRYVKLMKLDPARLSLPDDPHPSPLKHRLLGQLLASAFVPHVIKHLELDPLSSN